MEQIQKVVLHWIPSHVGTVGNELAGEVAKVAPCFNAKNDRIPLSISQIKAKLDTSANAGTRQHYPEIMHSPSVSTKWFLRAAHTKSKQAEQQNG